MASLAERADPKAIEAATRSFWVARTSPGAGFPPVGPAAGPSTHEFVGTLFPSDDPFQLWHRGILADVHRRYLAMTGRRVRSSARIIGGMRHDGAKLLSTLAEEGVVVENARAPNAPKGSLDARVQSMVEALAHRGLLVGREATVPTCPRCLLPRAPEAIIYQEDDGSSFLVRFPLRGVTPRTSLLVWTDYAWKLLGTTAVALGTDLTYVTVRFRRRDQEETLVLAKEALPRLREWHPGGEVTVLEEHRGSEFAGRAYDHPLSVEYPTVASLPPPAGTVVAAASVTSEQTGVVALVPAHGPTDSAIGLREHVPELPVTTPEGRIERVVMHKYAGLPLEIAEAFILRDLNDGESLFAELRTRRGVPHCAACGTALLWLPTRTWFLSPARLSPDLLELRSRLLPSAPPLSVDDPLGWVAARGPVSAETGDPTLLECDRCDRLAGADPSGDCPCGGTRHPVRRRLVTSLRESLESWASHEPFESGDSALLVLPERRSGPALVHHLVALQALGPRLSGVQLLRAPSVRPPEPSASDRGIDARRAALVRTTQSPRVGPTLPDRERREARRLARVWHLARAVLEGAAADGFHPDRTLLSDHRSELREEDAAFVSSFERMRAQAFRLYESVEPGEAATLLGEFVERELLDGYLRLVGPRLRSPGLPPAKVPVYRVLFHVLPLWVELYAPVAPFTMEAVHRAFRGDAQSVFERTFTPVQEALIDPKAEEAARAWKQAIEGLARARRTFGIGREGRLENAVIVAKDEAVGASLRVSESALARLALVTQLHVASPSSPWTGAQVVAEPVLEEIQRVYPSQGPRIARLLQQVKPRRIQEGLAAGNLTVALDGVSVSILPGMVEISESLPERTVAVPWEGGEIYLTLPSILLAGEDARPPAVSVEGSQILREVRRRLSRRTDPEPASRAVVSASGALANELATRAAAVARYWGVGEVTVQPSATGPVRSECIRGRSRRGNPWTVWVPGARLPRRPRKRRTPRSAAPRVRYVELGPEASEGDFLTEEVVHRGEAIRGLVEQLDSALGLPIVGPTKLGNAWTAGVRDLDSFRAVPYDTLSAVPGFGPILADTIVRRFGGPVPPRPPRVRPAIGGVQPFETRAAATIDVPTPEPELLPAEGATPAAPEQSPVAPEAVRPPPASPPVLPPSEWRPVAELPPPPLTPPVAPPSPPREERAFGPPVEIPVEGPGGATPPAIVPSPAPPAMRFGVEVWPGPSSEPAWRRFLDLTAIGVRGLCFTREFPDRIRGALGSRSVEVAWLSNTGREGSVRPGDLTSVQGRVSEAISQRNVRAVYVGGMEYLLSLHGREKVGAFLQALAEVAGTSHARIWVPMNPALVVPGAAEELAAQFPPEPSQ